MATLDDNPDNSTLSDEEGALILQLWASSVELAGHMPTHRRALVSGLEEVLVALSRLPDAIGWGNGPHPSEIKPAHTDEPFKLLPKRPRPS